MANRIPQVDYYPTESEIARMLSQNSWRMMFARDYASIKGNIQNVVTATEGNSETIETLDARLDIAEGKITTIIGRVDTLETELDTHVAATSAHGANGNIVGTNNYASLTTGGTVLLAATQADAVASSVAVTSPDAGAAPATYTQAQMATVVALVNELKADLTQAVSDLNAAIAVINGSLSTERTAKQRQL